MGIIQNRNKQIKLLTAEKRIKKLKSDLEPKENLLFKASKPFEVIDKIMVDIAQFGTPFHRHKRGSKVYELSFKRITRLYKKHGKNIIPPFKLGHEFFNNPKFVYRPPSISIADFIKFTSKSLAFSPYAKIFSEKYNVNSLFDVFLKGRDYINANFLKVKVEKQDDELINEFKEIWEKLKPELEEKDNMSISQFIANCTLFSEKNKNVSVRNIFYILEQSILCKTRYNVQSPQQLNTKLFWEVFLPKEIVAVGLYHNTYDITILEKLIE